MTQSSSHLLAGGPDASRSLVYAAFAAAFEYPDPEGLELIRSGSLANALRQLLSGIDTGLVDATDWNALAAAGVDDALQVDYTRLFDAGTDGPAAPMNATSYGAPRLETQEELVRFYNFFGLSLSQERQGEPDRLTTQLEFLHYLTYQEVQLLAAGDDVNGLLRGQRDFIERHPGAWVPALRGQLARVGAMDYFLELAALLERFLHSEQARLDEQIARLPDGELDPDTSTPGLTH